MRRTDQLSIVTAILVMMWGHTALAFQIQSGFSDPCHETLTLAAANESLIEDFGVGDDVPLPSSDDWESIAEGIVADLAIEYADERERFLLVSLAIGSRWPDTKGHALLDSSAMRDAHVDSADQYSHALRAAGDDFEKGNVTAIRGSRATILRHLDAATHYLSLPPEQQLIQRSVVVDYYGEIAVELWAPAFHLGYAAHTFQDSFSHSIRTEDLRRILHVMNFTEATRGEAELDRDGLPHSGAMDDCEVRASEIAETARDATRELFEAFLLREFAGEEVAVGHVLDEWMRYEPGCTPDNDFCDSPWLSIAEEDPAQPILRSTFGCQTADSRQFALWALALALCAWHFRRRRRLSAL